MQAQQKHICYFRWITTPKWKRYTEHRRFSSYSLYYEVDSITNILPLFEISLNLINDENLRWWIFIKFQKIPRKMPLTFKKKENFKYYCISPFPWILIFFLSTKGCVPWVYWNVIFFFSAQLRALCVVWISDGQLKAFLKLLW